MSDRYSVIPRTMCFVFRDDKVLLIKASEKKDWEGKYDPVGGHIEEGEEILSSAKREIREETGLDINNIKLSGVMHVSNFFGKDIMLFVTSCDVESDEVISNHEGELEWVNINKISEVDIFDDVEEIMKKVINGEFFTGTIRFDDVNNLREIKFHLN